MSQIEERELTFTLQELREKKRVRWGRKQGPIVEEEGWMGERGEGRWGH